MRTKQQDRDFNKIEALVNKALETEDYNFIRQAMDMAYDTGIFMAEDDEFVMVGDEVFYFDGRWGSKKRPEY